ncbi:hypothetical protein LTR85_010537 [Meristemomyces frigidus]|nr:hypothetical protein LTR85_010537 [Meristemomyces frigidus]
MVPKANPPEKKRSKQVRLAPLGTTQSARAFLRLDPELLLRRPRRSPEKKCAPPIDKPAIDRKASAFPPPPSAVPETASVVDEADEGVGADDGDEVEDGDEVHETDIEESVWCGSDRVADSSEDELPSPSKFIKCPPRKLFPSASADNAGLDLAHTLTALRISDSPPPSLPVFRPTANVDIASRPTSSSDKENDHKAILRFSPPRLHSPRKQQTPERAVTPPPTSPSKGRLLSPSKRAPARVPTPPFRPSLDGFWNAETVNDWNDQYSPRKEWASPRKLKLLADEASTSPTASPRKAQSPAKRTKAEIAAKKDWETRKHHIAEAFLAELDRTITAGQIAELARSTGGVRFIWSKTLNSTAGRANWKRETTKTRHPDGSTTIVHKHHASIELAEKVIDDQDRLLNVIAHEFCHLANFMVSGVKDQPHGRQFKDWGRKCTAAFAGRGVEVTTKHSYQIEYKYVWRCANGECGAEFKRHSKSIDVKRHTCGSCRGQLQQIKPVPRQGAGGGGGGGNGYAAFVKQHFASVKAGLPGASQKQVMEAVARQYRAEKASSIASTADGVVRPRAVDASDAADVFGKKAGGDGDKVARVLKFITIDDD